MSHMKPKKKTIQPAIYIIVLPSQITIIIIIIKGKQDLLVYKISKVLYGTMVSFHLKAIMDIASSPTTTSSTIRPKKVKYYHYLFY